MTRRSIYVAVFLSEASMRRFTWVIAKVRRDMLKRSLPFGGPASRGEQTANSLRNSR
jgi:hypothetical protein